MSDYRITRVHLSLSSWVGLAPTASHWYCRLRWTDSRGADHELDAERGRGLARTRQYADKATARRAGVALAKRACRASYVVVTEGHEAVIDPQECLSAPELTRQAWIIA